MKANIDDFRSRATKVDPQFRKYYETALYKLEVAIEANEERDIIAASEAVSAILNMDGEEEEDEDGETSSSEDFDDLDIALRQHKRYNKY